MTTSDGKQKTARYHDKDSEATRAALYTGLGRKGWHIHKIHQQHFATSPWGRAASLGWPRDARLAQGSQNVAASDPFWR